ncbi:unnamed protein product [Acanthoscelides obtectus]|uniref:CLIP domain-containing serine protease n=2 Tax=Acanthoscelides obtectus TaxID=200917 RepID=A0A9P0K2Z8_ACAOB|nr:unnamed protein product [Acanthoscelides obtectus]CAK1664008.1 hypothetical protein AOBTE_LOCUS23999 [Acanthoscelides obtectus]
MFRCGCVVVLWFLLFSGTGDAGRMLISLPSVKCDSAIGEVCIEIRKCPYFDDLLNRSTIPRPRGVIKIIRENQCGFYGSIPFVCCSRFAAPPPPTLPPLPSPTRSMLLAESSSTRRPISHILSRFTTLTAHRNYGQLRNDICGSIQTNTRITGGKKTAINEFPWMALLAYYQDGVLDFRCGGAVINEWYILTAAHCIVNSTIVGVRLGEHNLNSDKDCDPNSHYCAPPTQDFYIEKVIGHPGYNTKTLMNDIALVKLAMPANFGYANVQPICLPIEDMELSGKFVIVTGWGITEDGFKSPELLKTSIPILPIEECRHIYRHFAPVKEAQICAGGYAGRDSCGGDSGGPMNYVGLVDGTPRFVQYGIVSYGPRQCGTDGQPAIYTKVAQYLEWILDNLESGVVRHL